MMDFAARLKQQRALGGYSLAEFAQLACVTEIEQKRFEQGRAYPSVKYLVDLWESAGIDFYYLITGKSLLSESCATNDELNELSSAWFAVCKALEEENKCLPAEKIKVAAQALYRAAKDGEF